MPNSPRRAFIQLRSIRLATVLLLLASSMVLEADAELLGDFLDGKIRAKGICASFYAGTSTRKCLEIRAGRVLLDHEKRGPFRIGVLPVAVLENATIIVPDPEFGHSGCLKLGELLCPDAARRVELRQARLMFPDGRGHTNTLEAGFFRAGRAGVLELGGGVQFRSATSTNQSGRGTLQLKGPAAGVLTLDRTSVPLFSRLQSPCSVSDANNQKPL